MRRPSGLTKAESAPRRRALLLGEYLVLFFGLPLAYATGLVNLPLIPALWLLALGCLVALLTDGSFNRRRLWNGRDLARRVVRAAVPFLVLAPVLGVALLLHEPQRLFAFVRRSPLVWLLVMVLYPVLSVYPQGIIYRTFIFHRYRPLFGSPPAMILASALAFAVVHLVFRNWVAPPLSLAGGILFAVTYERTRSALVAAIQHALFGCFVFTVGWGWYFYHGAG